MELRQARYFLAACDTLNFTRAAEVCAISTASLSRAIKALEEEFGGELFRRERQLTHLTDLGKLMREHLSVAVGAADKAQRLAQCYMRSDAAPLEIGVQRELPSAIFAPYLKALSGSAVGVELRLSMGAESRLIEKLMRGDIDVALMEEGRYEDRIVFLPLFSERYVLALQNGHPLASRSAAPFEALKDLPLIRGWSEGFSISLARAGLAPPACSAESGAAVGDVQWRLSMVAAGLGVAIATEFADAPTGVALRPLTAPDLVRRIGLTTVSGRRRTPPVALALRTAQSQCWPEIGAALAAFGAAAPQ